MKKTTKYIIILAAVSIAVVFSPQVFALGQNIINTSLSVMCPSNLQLHENLRSGAYNGRYNSYTRGVVTEAHILQKHLNRLGFASGVEDGKLGPISTGAIKRMQLALGTIPDGFVGPITRAILNNSCKAHQDQSQAIDQYDDSEQQDADFTQDDFTQVQENDHDHSHDTDVSSGDLSFSEGGAEFKTVGYYNVVGNSLKFFEGVDSKTYRSVWDTFQKIIPADLRASIVEFDAYNDPDGWLAGSMSTTGSINPVQWGLSVNIDMTTTNGKVNDEGLELLIHEFGHVLTLADDQMKHVDSENKTLVKKVKKECKTFFVSSIEGCLYSNSYLNKFINKFWSDKEYLHRTLTEITFNAREGHQTDFVSGYAASTPVEDIAESFAHFVLKDKPTGSTIAEQKMLFFYDYPDFVRLRDHVHANADIQWSKKINFEN